MAHALKSCLQAINLSDAGVYVQASTLGSLEALLDYLAGVKVAVRSPLRPAPRLVARLRRVFSFVSSRVLLLVLYFITFEYCKFHSPRSGRSNQRESIRKVRVPLMQYSLIPLQYSGVNIGPIHKSDVMKASVMLEKDRQCANPSLIALYT